METVFKIIFGPSIPLWLKIIVLTIAGVLLVIWLVKPPHWADLDTLDHRDRYEKRRARPPD